MNRCMAFSSRNIKEIVRDPLTLVFGIGFPIILIFLMSMLQRSIPEMPEIFSIKSLAPGMAVFGLSFISLFLGILVAGDRDSSFLMRIFASPMTENDYIIGYALPMLPVGILQCIVCFLFSALFGLQLNVNVFVALAVLIPVILLYIGFGLLFGTLLNGKQVGGIASILVNVAAWLSGTWFDLNMIGGTFKSIGYALPFAHAVDAVRAAMNGNFGNIFPHLWWVIGYAVVITVLSAVLFRKRMKN